MRIVFTNHALFQMHERRIAKQEVLDALQFPESFAKKLGKYYARRNVGRGVIEAVCILEQNLIKVITVYWV